MRILHIGLAASFNQTYTYQENLLTEQNIKDGHETYYISGETPKNHRDSIGKLNKEVMENGLVLYRLKYKWIFNRFTSCKLRIVSNLYLLIQSISPDIIFCHDLASGSSSEIIRYVTENRKTVFLVDTHATFENSGRNLLSRYVLHKLIYGRFYRKAYAFMERYYYVAEESKSFSKNVYKLPEEKMEFFPLGGVVFDDESYFAFRNKRREELGIKENDLLFIHSGKLDPLKKTEELLNAFKLNPQLDASLVIIGSIPDKDDGHLLRMIESDERVMFLGWKSGRELLEYLCAADLYCQPGSMSATMQNAVCCRCPVMCYPFQSYIKLNRGSFQFVKTVKEIAEVFSAIHKCKIDLGEASRVSEELARTELDYKILARKMYHLFSKGNLT